MVDEFKNLREKRQQEEQERAKKTREERQKNLLEFKNESKNKTN